MYSDIIAQSSSSQEILNERYDMVLGKLNEQRFVKGELRRYMQAITRLEKKLELHYLNDEREIGSPLQRISEVQEVIKKSVHTINRLAEASYISKDIIKGFPTFEEPETKRFSQGRFNYDERIYQDLANDKGQELAKSLREKRRSEIRSTYTIG